MYLFNYSLHSYTFTWEYSSRTLSPLIESILKLKTMIWKNTLCSTSPLNVCACMCLSCGSTCKSLLLSYLYSPQHTPPHHTTPNHVISMRINVWMDIFWCYLYTNINENPNIHMYVFMSTCKHVHMYMYLQRYIHTYVLCGKMKWSELWNFDNFLTTIKSYTFTYACIFTHTHT